MGAHPACEMPPLGENATQPFVGQLTFYHFNMILSGSATAFVCLSMFTLIFLHATHFSNPAEQAKIIKITYLIPLYSIWSFLGIVFPYSYVSLQPWTEFFQSICLGTFFLLLCEMVSPHENQRDMFFAALKEVPLGVGNKTRKLKEGEGLVWFRRRWIAVFQYPAVALIVAVVTDATDAVNLYCDTSTKPYYAHIWMVILSNVSVSIAVTSVLFFYQVLKNHLAHHRPLAKLAAFKAVIFLVFIQGIVFTALRSQNKLISTPTLTYADLTFGIPTLIICLEMAIISVFFHYAYTYRPYVLNSPSSHGSGKPAPLYKPTSYQGGFLGYRALLLAMSPLEVIEAQIFALKLFSSSDRRQTPVEQREHVGMEPLRSKVSNSSEERTWPGAVSEQQQQQYQGRQDYGYPQPALAHQQGGTAYQPLNGVNPEGPLSPHRH